MKNLLIVPLFIFGSSIALADSCADGKGCSADKKSEKSGAIVETITLAGAGCGGSCTGDKKDTKKETESGMFVEIDALLAGAGCGGSCSDGDKKDKKKETKSEFIASDSALV